MEYDYSKPALIERGKYLTEVIDKIPDKASYKDIEALGEGNKVICWGPSSGKTTAIRQFIINHLEENGLFATKLVEDVDSLHYDIIAQLTYLGKDPDHMQSMIKKFHSNSKNYRPYDLQISMWIICTHERLFIEPPSLLYTMDMSVLGHMLSNGEIPNIYRKYLFIDEYPSNLYKEFKISELTNLKLFDYEAGTKNSQGSRFAKSVTRANYVGTLYEKPTTDQVTKTMMDNLPTPTDQSYRKDIARGEHSAQSEFSKQRISFFADCLLNKLEEYEETTPFDQKKDDDKLYYTINDLMARNKYLFDGTGDLLFKGSQSWDLVRDDRFGRKLELRNDVTLIDSYVHRNSPIEDIVNEYGDVLTQILDLNPDKNLLVYLWKTAKNEDNDEQVAIVKGLKNYFNESQKSRLEFIHYMSGKERVTSDYKDFDIAVILGEFFIPNSIISRLNQINKSRIENNDHTISLLIQFIYRTAARIGQPIDLYISNSYENKLIRDLLKSFDLVNQKEFSPNHIKPNYIASNSLLTKIINSENYISKTENSITIKSNDLRLLLNLTSNDNGKINNKLVSNGINFEFIKGSGRRPSQYTIHS